MLQYSLLEGLCGARSEGTADILHGGLHGHGVHGRGHELGQLAPDSLDVGPAARAPELGERALGQLREDRVRGGAEDAGCAPAEAVVVFKAREGPVDDNDLWSCTLAGGCIHELCHGLDSTLHEDEDLAFLALEALATLQPPLVASQVALQEARQCLQLPCWARHNLLAQVHGPDGQGHLAELHSPVGAADDVDTTAVDAADSCSALRRREEVLAVRNLHSCPVRRHGPDLPQLRQHLRGAPADDGRHADLLSESHKVLELKG
mmetsp:Transcript_23374/g.66603  ORF Transcript_23374/g.66603 Transcript_23374/m.66603 type:complete len:263 (-) Transcript_23374:1646-2434(-)